MGREHWVETSIGSIVLNRKGKKPNTLLPEKKEGYLPYILIDELEGNIPRNYANALNLPIASKEDVLLVWDGSIGKCSSGIEGIIGSTLVALTPLGEIPTKFLEYIIINANRYIKDTSTGTGLQHINKNFLNEYVTPLPPLNEQKHIVEKLDAILPRVKSVKARLEKIPAILKKFRQSIIIAAFNGSLTDDFRNTLADESNGLSLLSKIEKNRKARKRTAEINLSNFDNNIPDEWTVVNIDTISDEIVDCPHSTPKWTQNGKLCLRTNNFLANKLFLEEKRFVSQDTFNKRIERLKPEFGDILYSREGGILGIACILDVQEEVCLGQRMMLFRINNNVLNKYVCYFLNSPLVYNHVNTLIGGSAAPHINVGDIKEFPIPLPSLEEQQEIVCRIEKLFALVDSLEAKYKKAFVRVEKIEQSILAKAFRGELVEPDPNDEPTEELLKRILEEKAKLVGVKKSKRTKKRPINNNATSKRAKK